VGWGGGYRELQFTSINGFQRVGFKPSIRPISVQF
jgi:hypothetical protein